LLTVAVAEAETVTMGCIGTMGACAPAEPAVALTASSAAIATAGGIWTEIIEFS
jgi:hypothetical protein